MTLNLGSDLHDCCYCDISIVAIVEWTDRPREIEYELASRNPYGMTYWVIGTIFFIIKFVIK